MAWGWKFTKGSASGFENVAFVIATTLRQRGIDAMKIVVDEAVQNAKKFTGDSQSGASKQERSGDLLASLDGETFLKSADVIVGEYGFINRLDLYFALQTVSGFHHVGNGEFIEPSFALRDATTIAIQHLLELLNEPIR